MGLLGVRMLGGFIKLYSHAIPINKLVPESNENFKCFSLKSGLPVGLVIVRDTISYQYPLKSFWKFFEENPYFWMIPMTTPTNKLIGFVLRGYHQKEYRTVFNYGENIPPVFGWEDFSDFSYNKPVVVCEGIKDAIWLKQYYKYTIALNGSSITNANLAIFKNMFSNVILCYDNDSAQNNTGEKSSIRDKKILEKLDINCRVIVPKHKDCAMFLEDSNGLEDFLNTFKKNIEIMGGFYGTH